MIGPVLLLTPPLTQLNTPYPATAYLTGLLRSRGHAVEQADLGIELALTLFSRAGLEAVFARARGLGAALPGEATPMLALERAYLDAIEPVVALLQGRDPSLAPLIARRGVLPEGPRFERALDRDRWSGVAPSDLAKRFATLFLEDLADLVRETVAPQFALSRYAEQVARSASSFEPLARALAAPPSLTDEWMIQALWRHVERVRPSLVGLTVPFPGNLYGALRVARALKARRPDLPIALGGGYVNTELRRLAEPRLFDCVDYVTLDDGERPLLCLLEHLDGKRDDAALRRTFLRSGGRVCWRDGAREPDLGTAEVGTPTYAGLPLDRYLSVLDTLNPMHRLWSDGHWNKLTVAHGCYWKQCTFCDVGLDYIGRYEAAPSGLLADRVEALIAETGRRSFHFVDEAAPPAGLKGLALALLERGVAVAWWGNIRFEAAFTPDLCRLLAASGCVAVSAGLEAASDRLLAEMKKGITVAQTARVAAAFRAAGIMVHAYLMYGLPGETIEETVEALERVRQLFAAGLLQSAFWHRFVATAHSPVGLDPAAHGLRILGPAFGGFAENDLIHEDRAGAAPDWLGEGLRRALLCYLEGEGLEEDVRRWFVPPRGRRFARPRVARDWAAREAAVAGRDGVADDPAQERRVVWIGGTPVVAARAEGAWRVILPGRVEDVELRLQPPRARWLLDLVAAATPTRERSRAGYPLLREVREARSLGGRRGFDALLRSTMWAKARAAGLLLV